MLEIPRKVQVFQVLGSLVNASKDCIFQCLAWSLSSQEFDCGDDRCVRFAVSSFKIGRNSIAMLEIPRKVQVFQVLGPLVNASKDCIFQCLVRSLSLAEFDCGDDHCVRFVASSFKIVRNSIAMLEIQRNHWNPTKSSNCPPLHLGNQKESRGIVTCPFLCVFRTRHKWVQTHSELPVPSLAPLHWPAFRLIVRNPWNHATVLHCT
jgi:hypothetical protein